MKSLETIKLGHTTSLLKLSDIDRYIDYADYEDSDFGESDTDSDWAYSYSYSYSALYLY